MASIYETARQSGSFNTLCRALEVTGLSETLQGQGSFTVFAPNDQAFQKLPQGMVENLLQDIPKLKQLLLYHVIDGEHYAEDVMEEEQLSSMQGERLSIDTSQGVMINQSHVVESDIEADNGVIHVIDSVMMPEVVARSRST